MSKRVRVPFKVMGKGGRARKLALEAVTAVTKPQPVRLPVAVPADPERMNRMTRAEALAMFEPLPLPTGWTVYATAPSGAVASGMSGMSRLLRAARLLHEMGTVELAQRRAGSRTEYLIRRRDQSHRSGG